MRFLIVALVAVGIIASSSVARADKRVAFVVGNGAYRNVATLPIRRSTLRRWLQRFATWDSMLSRASILPALG